MNPTAHEIAIGASLGKAAHDVAPTASGVWELTLRNGGPFPARARVDDGWLTLTASLGPPSGLRQAWWLLQANAALRAGARLALGAAGEIVALGDLPLDADLDVGTRIQETCRALETAKARVDGEPEPYEPQPHVPALSIPSPDALAGVCAETEWPARRHEDGRLGVDLEVPGAFHEAVLGARDEDTVVWTPLFDDVMDGTQALTPASRHALAVLLLRTCGLVRMVRACAAPDDAEQRLWLEVPLPGFPSPAELSHALSALSVACRIAGREATVLRHDQTVAALYVRQWTDKHEEE